MLGLVLQPYHLLVPLFHLHFLQQKVKSTHYMAIRKMVYGALTRDVAALPKHCSTHPRCNLLFHLLRSPASTKCGHMGLKIRCKCTLKMAKERVRQSTHLCYELSHCFCFRLHRLDAWDGSRCESMGRGRSRWFKYSPPCCSCPSCGYGKMWLLPIEW